jgi:hypothetical protein
MTRARMVSEPGLGPGAMVVSGPGLGPGAMVVSGPGLGPGARVVSGPNARNNRLTDLMDPLDRLTR